MKKFHLISMSSYATLKLAFFTNLNKNVKKYCLLLVWILKNEAFLYTTCEVEINIIYLRTV